MQKLKFIDLFAGLGGFHIALSRLGCECVFASELRDDLRRLYIKNFPEMEGNTKSGIKKVEGDITKVPLDKIPKFEILCGGFPCQPFSQAGKRQGFNDEKDRGNLFNYICEIVRIHKPKYILLENVSNLKGHDNGNTWNTIYHRLSDDEQDGGLGYEVREDILSPHEFGIPQHRQRIYIVAVKRTEGQLPETVFPMPTNTVCNINSIIEPEDTNIVKLKAETRTQIAIWQEFLNKTKENGDEIPSFPIWAMEFGATYDFTGVAPAYQSLDNLRGKKGKLGKVICGTSLEECLSQLPNYAQTKVAHSFPDWKKRYIEQNRAFYIRHKAWLDEWLLKVNEWENSHLKLEWNCGKNAEPDLSKTIIQFRASGIRAKLPTFSPALNLVGTQTPIFPWVELPQSVVKPGEPNKGRYMTVKECARLQGMEDLILHDPKVKESLTRNRAIEALGNAINVNIVELIAKQLLSV